MADAYEIDIATGKGMALSGGGGIKDTVRSVIRRISTGEIVWSSASYWASDPPRNLKAMAGRERKKWEHYLAKHGEGWEEKTKREKLAKQLEQKRAGLRRRYLAGAAEDMLKALPAGPLADKINAKLAEIEAVTDPKHPDIEYE